MSVSALLSQGEVRRRMLAKIAASKLTADDAAKLGFRPAPHPPTSITLKGAGFLIPYFNILGHKNGFFRWRYLEDIRVGGKPVRYTQPAGKSPEPYFTPLVPWVNYLKQNAGENRVIFLTEGENKANCAAKFGLPAIGLGGVWNFKSRNEALIAGLKQIEWEAATVYIVYDSDAVSNYQVVMAENALAKELLDQGAFVYIVRLPALAEGAKTGLDDYLVARGREEFDQLLTNTAPWTASRQLHELNEEVVFIHDPGAVLEINSMQRMSPSVFTGSVYANRTWEEIVYGPQGKPRTVKRSAATEWMRWAGRGEVRRTTYQPGLPRILEDTRELNTWTGWGVEPEHVRPGAVKLWHEFMAYFFKGADAEDRTWFEQWLAYPIQYPGTKLFTAVVIHSLEQGTGKTLLAYTMKRLYGRNFSEITESQLLGDFNEWAENKQFVMGDEISGGDKRASNDRLKAVITREEIRINAKYVPTYNVPDCINYYFTSNHPDSFFLDDADRRYFIHELRCGPLPLDWAARYDRWYNSAEGIGALFYYFLHNVDTSRFNPKAPARDTAAKRQMVAIGRSEAGAWVAALRETPERVLRLGSNSPPITFSLMTTDEIFRLYDPSGTGKVTRPGLSRELKRGGFRQVNNGEPVRTVTNGTVRLWAVQGPHRAVAEHWKPAKIAEVYDGERQLQIRKAKVG